MRKIVLAGVLLAAACAQNRYQEIVIGWVGAPEAELVEPPRKAEPGITLVAKTANGAPTAGAPRTTLAYACQTIFELRNGIVVDWRSRGDRCVAK